MALYSLVDDTWHIAIKETANEHRTSMNHDYPISDYHIEELAYLIRYQKYSDRMHGKQYIYPLATVSEELIVRTHLHFESHSESFWFGPKPKKDACFIYRDSKADKIENTIIHLTADTDNNLNSALAMYAYCFCLINYPEIHKDEKALLIEIKKDALMEDSYFTRLTNEVLVPKSMLKRIIKPYEWELLKNDGNDFEIKFKQLELYEELGKLFYAPTASIAFQINKVFEEEKKEKEINQRIKEDLSKEKTKQKNKKG